MYIMQELKHAARSLARAPGFTVAAVLTLALGIGANTAIFSVINGVILRPLPFPRPHELIYITSQFLTQGFDQFPVDGAEFFDLRERSRSFRAVGAYATGAVNLGADGNPIRVVSAVASASLFDVLGVRPLQGRTFTEDETLPNRTPVVMLSREVWLNAFGGRPILGQQIPVDGISSTVVGIMPSGFDVHDQGIKVWLPLILDPAQRKQYRSQHFLDLVGRLKDGVSLKQARSELEVMLAQWHVVDGGAANGAGYLHTPDAKDHRLRYDDLRADMVGGIGRALWTLQAAVAFVLLIACANLANLLLMRAGSKYKEFAVRAALGARRGRLMLQFFAESVVLAVSGAVVGVGMAYFGLRILVAAGSSSIPRAGAIAIDGRVLSFTLLLAMGTAFLFGIGPALQMSAGNLGLTLREAGSRTTAIGARARMRRALAVAEMALTVMLVIGAGLLLKSFGNMMKVDAGFDRTHLTTFGVALPPKVYVNPTRSVIFYENLVRELSAVPGVTAVTAMTGLPPQRRVDANSTMIEGFTPVAHGSQQNIDYYQYAMPTYFSTMKIPIVSGRPFDLQDGPASAPVAIINQTMARLYYPNQDPIGRRVKAGGDTVWTTIVGVAKDVKQGGVDSKTGTELYLAYEQSPAARRFTPLNLNIVIRSDLDKVALAPSIRRVVGSLDPSLPIVQLRSMDEVFTEAVARPHFLAELLGVFAMVAMVLSAVGTYGVLAYSVTERVREFGIRMALGANARNVLAMVLRQGLTLACIGLVVGVLGAVALTGVMSTLLFEVKPVDPVTFVAVSAFMLLVAAAASAIPAGRATQVEPLTALRSE